MTDNRQPIMHDSHASAVAHPHAAAGRAAHHPHVNYLAIFVALCVCTLLSAIFDFLPLNRRTVAVMVLAVAVAKAQYVMRYFMHLKFEGKWKYVLLLPTAILACGIPLALAPDIGLHYYVPEIPQVHTQSTARGGHNASATRDEAEHPAAGHDAATGHEGIRKV
jgi:cytochrome c oxidase subunit 4